MLGARAATSGLFSIGGVKEIPGNRFYGKYPLGRNSSFTLFSVTSVGAAALQAGIGFLSGGYSDSIGFQATSTRSVKRSPIKRSVMIPLRFGKFFTNPPKLKPS